tara:strand:+ start:23 stop:199 length:177 start_codon:yes stop_codon:yes gene_type:complete
MHKKTKKILDEFINEIDINKNYSLIELKKILFKSYQINKNNTIKLVHEKPLLFNNKYI